MFIEFLLIFGYWLIAMCDNWLLSIIPYKPSSRSPSWLGSWALQHTQHSLERTMIDHYQLRLWPLYPAYWQRITNTWKFPSHAELQFFRTSQRWRYGQMTKGITNLSWRGITHDLSGENMSTLKLVCLLTPRWLQMVYINQECLHVAALSTCTGMSLSNL